MEPKTYPVDDDAVMFSDEEEDSNPIATDEQIAEWKAKLVIATNHADRNVELKKMISGDIGARVKHYRKLQTALAAAIRDKSPLALEWAFSREEGGYSQALANLKPRETYCDSLKIWLDSEKGEDQ